MPGRGGAGNFKAAVKNVDGQTKGSVQSLAISHASSSSSSRKSTFKTKAGITIAQRPAPQTLKSGRRGFAHIKIETAPECIPPQQILSPSLSKFDFTEDDISRCESNLGLSPSIEVDIKPPTESISFSPARGGRGGIGNNLRSPVTGSGQSVISSISGGSSRDKSSDSGVIELQSKVILVTTTITVDSSPIDIVPP